jgi:hypothetical protein
MVTSHQRGHRIVYRKEWVYQDDNGSIKNERPCVKCGEMPTIAGYDACLGYLVGIQSACCGHGVEKPYVVKQ